MKKKKKVFARLLVGGIALNLLALCVLMLKIAYPYSRAIAFILYGLSWGVFWYLLRKRILSGYREHKKFFKKYSRQLAASAVALISIGIGISLFPMDDFRMVSADKRFLDEKILHDKVYAEKYIQKLKEMEMALFNQIGDGSPDSMRGDHKEAIKETWRDYLNYSLSLEEIVDQYKYFYQINYVTDKSLNERSFMLAYACHVANYSSYLNLVHFVEAHAMVEAVLNEESSEQGIPKNAYYKIQKIILNPDNMTEVFFGRAYMESIHQDALADLKQYSEDNFRNIAQKTGKNPDIHFNGALDYFEKNMFKAWFPVQKDVAERMGDTKIPLSSKNFIDREMIGKIRDNIYPGDIFLQRRNWYVSNAGLPGFWKHTVIYLGSLSDLDASFPPSEITDGLALSEYIKEKYPTLYEELKDGQKRTIEAESEGVVSFTLEKSMSADYAAVLRPKISREDTLKSLIRAFDQFGKPYDFNFDFLTDNEIVCSELYYKSFPMMRNRLRMVSGRMALSSNHIAQDFDAQYGNQQNLLEFVYFIDADEETKKAFFGDLLAFRQSWKRSETDIAKAMMNK